MSDPKQQQEQQADEDQIADLTVPEAQAEEVGGGLSLPNAKIEVTYTPQKP